MRGTGTLHFAADVSFRGFRDTVCDGNPFKLSLADKVFDLKKSPGFNCQCWSIIRKTHWKIYYVAIRIQSLKTRDI